MRVLGGEVMICLILRVMEWRIMAWHGHEMYSKTFERGILEWGMEGTHFGGISLGGLWRREGERSDLSCDGGRSLGLSGVFDLSWEARRDTLRLSFFFSPFSFTFRLLLVFSVQSR